MALPQSSFLYGVLAVGSSPAAGMEDCCPAAAAPVTNSSDASDTHIFQKRMADLSVTMRVVAAIVLVLVCM